ncbi:MAG: 30S ribosomal protein S2 [Chloroflexi bacterium]|nr:30S ribosomal protein S2 [Chloroflexota bacterium]
MAVVTMKALLESGVHFGHRTNKWNPRMKPYIFTERNGIHIIDLQQTVKAITNAFNAVRDVVATGGVVMFVGTKRQAQETVHDEAIRCGMPYVTERWLGGMLTNWSTMHQRIVELERMEKLFATGDIDKLTKKEALLIQREITRLNTHLSGVRNMVHVPDLVLVVDVSREYAAVHEANLLNIPVIALVDTNCDPTAVDYVIPSNDDAIRAIKLLVAKMADAVEEGKALRKDEELEAEAAESRFAEASTDLVKRPAHAIDTEEELKDDELLGESTLAKLAPVPAIEEVTVEEVVIEETATEEAVIDEDAGKEKKE